MGFSSFWTSITGGPRVREITPPKKRYGNLDSRPATSSGVRTVRRTPSVEDDGRELSQVESMVTRNIIDPPPGGVPTGEEKKSRRRSRGLSLSRSKTDDGTTRRRRSIFGGGKDAAKEEPVPEVPTLPTLSSFYFRQAPRSQAPQSHQVAEPERPSTAVSAVAERPSTAVSVVTPTTPTSRLPIFCGSAPLKPLPQKPIASSVGEAFELHAESAAPPPPSPPPQPIVAELPAASTIEVTKSRRRSIGEALSGKRSKSMGSAGPSIDTTAANAPFTPALPRKADGPTTIKPIAVVSENGHAPSRRNSNASAFSAASNASKTSCKSKRESWGQRPKSRDEEVALLPPLPSGLDTRGRKTASPDNVELSAFPAVPTKKKPVDDDAASIRTTRSEKATARSTQRSKSKKRPQSTASHVRRKRRSSWWASSNPDYSDDEPAPPPVPALSHSTRTTPNTSPTTSENAYTTAVRGDNIKSPRPVSTISTTSRPYVPRSAAKSFLMSTTPVSDNVRKSIRRSMHDAGQPGFEEGGRGTYYCLSAEQQREWEKLKHLMAVMDRRRDATRTTFGEESVAEMFPAVPQGGGMEEREGVKFRNRDALKALEVGVAK